jgi:hypothetical protein
LKIAKRLLCRNAGHFVEPRRLGLAFQGCQRLGGLSRPLRAVALRVIHALAGPECLCSGGKCPVVDVTHAPEGPRQNPFLFWRRIKAVRPSLVHSLHIAWLVCKDNRFWLTPELLSLPDMCPQGDAKGVNAGASQRAW